MAFKLLLQLILATAISPIQSRIVSEHSGSAVPIAPNIHRAITSHPQYGYTYNANDASSGDSKLQHEMLNGGMVQGPYPFIEPDGHRRVVHYNAGAVNGLNAIIHKDSASSGRPVHPIPAPLSVMTPTPIGPMENHQQLPVAPSFYPHQLHSSGSRPVSHQLQPAFQPHRPVLSVPTSPGIIQHPQSGHQLPAPKISVPTASAIIRPHIPVMQKSHMQSAIIPYSQASGGYHQSQSMAHSQAPVFVVQPFTWYSKTHQSSAPSPMNPAHKQPGMLPIVRVPTATIRPKIEAPAYGKIPSDHPNAINHHEEQPPPYLNSGMRPIILGRYGYALTNAPFKIKY